ncbi:MAG: hypothetical protein U0805_06675 [Pirellulales bacterium]
MRYAILVATLCLVCHRTARCDRPIANAETLPEITARLARETAEAYRTCRFSALSTDYFNRFSLDPNARPTDNEIAIDSSWQIAIRRGSGELVTTMAGHLRDFLRQRLRTDMPIVQLDQAALSHLQNPSIVLTDTGGGDLATKESFTIRVVKDLVTVAGDSPAGLRDGVVRLVDRMGFREAPILELGAVTYQPRLPVRLGAVPMGGSIKDAVFLGYNAVLYGGGDLYALSTSDAIPELVTRRVGSILEEQQENIGDYGAYGLNVYAWLNTRQKFPKDDPVFLAHPEIRGALTWSADGEYTLCTSHPLVRRYLKESVQGLFRALPQLRGVVLIVGGEGFYHCHMRPFGVPKGHTNCPRCEPLGAETAVADLCNDLAAAARSVRPDAEIVLWPYSAEHVWAADAAATGFLEKLKPGTALLTEIEKSEVISKADGVQKSIWDYSIDFIGPATRTKQQIAVCAKYNIPVYVKSEPELAFEAPLLPQIPCLDRWFDRGDVLASCGASGAWVFPAFRMFYAGSTAEVNKYLWWTPAPDREQLLHALARRIGGQQSANRIRSAWKLTSEAVAFSPELPSYYTGPYYLGPMQPMCADPTAPLPTAFFGQFLFQAEIKDSEGVKQQPIFNTSPTGNVPVFLELYRQMRDKLAAADSAVRAAAPLVDERHRLTFDAEAIPIEWFYCTARTQANFYESCQLRDGITAIAKKNRRSSEERAEALKRLTRWRAVLNDELENTKLAIPLMHSDMRLDPYYGGDHTFPHGEETLNAKLTILQKEIDEYLPSIEVKLQRN